MQWLKALSLYATGKESDDEYTGISQLSRELGAIQFMADYVAQTVTQR
ncbi:MAG: hypothetical protein ACJAX5_003684 [Patiriisocius sp.]|jgi:hypothetical protein